VAWLRWQGPGRSIPTSQHPQARERERENNVDHRNNKLKETPPKTIREDRKARGQWQELFT